jgi:hypothetical protein
MGRPPSMAVEGNEWGWNGREGLVWDGLGYTSYSIQEDVCQEDATAAAALSSRRRGP